MGPPRTNISPAGASAGTPMGQDTRGANRVPLNGRHCSHPAKMAPTPPGLSLAGADVRDPTWADGTGGGRGLRLHTPVDVVKVGVSACAVCNLMR